MNLNENEREILMNALKAVEKMMSEQREKKLNKLNKKIKLEGTYSELMKTLTLDELKTVRKEWGFTGISNLKKDELVGVLTERICENFKDKISTFDSERIEVLEDIIMNNGILRSHNLNENKLFYYRDLGIAFSGIDENKEQAMVMPKELIEKCKQCLKDKEVKKEISENDELLKLSRGIIHYYGALKIDTLARIMEKLLGTKIQYKKYAELLTERRKFEIDFNINSDIISHLDVYDYNSIIEDNSQEEYYPITKLEATLAGNKGFVETNDARRNLWSLIIKTYKIAEDEAEEIVNGCVYAFKNNNDVAFALEYLKQYLSIEDMNIFTKLLKALGELQDNTRLWRLKGYTMKEIKSKESDSNETVRKSMQVGRNEPCPCGSGRKYKKCCGKN